MEDVLTQLTRQFLPQMRLIGQNVCPRWGHRRRSMPLFQPFKFRARF